MSIEQIKTPNFKSYNNKYNKIQTNYNANNSSYINRTIKKTNPDKNGEKTFLYLAAAGIAITAGIHLARKGKASSARAVSDNIPVQRFSDYILELVNDMRNAFKEDIKPESLLCVMSKEEFVSEISKLKKENYIASAENIEKGIFCADLHSHSVFSDGKGSVSDILEGVCSYADKLHRKNGKKFIFALTDHDSADGVKEALHIISKNPDKFKNVRFVTGSEVSYLIKSNKTSNPAETSELLVYGFNPFSKKVENFFENVRNRRIKARLDYIEELSGKFPETKFSEEEFLDIFLGDRKTHHPMMNSFWKVYHYGQIKKVLSDTAKAKGLNPEEYFKTCMSKAPQNCTLDGFKQHGLIEDWISENEEIRVINKRYLPEIAGNGEFIPKSENTAEDIANAFRGEKECTMGFAHPFFISERNDNILDILKYVKEKIGSQVMFTESYHMAYSKDILQRFSGEIARISEMFEGEKLIPIGGRDNHYSSFLNL